MIPTAYLQQLKDRGLLKQLYLYGLINHKAYMMLEVRMKVDAYMRGGLGKEEAVQATMKQTNMSRATIYRYL